MTNTLGKNDIRFIEPKQGFKYQYIQDSGYDIREPYIGNRLFLRVFREIFFRLNLPFKSLWYNWENANISQKVIFLYEGLVIPEYIEWLHKKNPETKIYLYYQNPVATSVNPKSINKDLCEMWSPDIKDCKRYGLHLFTGSSYFKKHKVDQAEAKTKKYDIFYIGRDKGRMEKISQLKTTFENLGLCVYFHITAERRYHLRRNKEYKKNMPYSEVLHKIAQSRAILHLSKGCQHGITMRIVESLLHRVKLITDDTSIKNYDFYNKNNIFVLGYDDIGTLPTFLNSPYEEVTSQIFKHIYFEDMIFEITGVVLEE